MCAYQWKRVPRACRRRQKDLDEKESVFLDKEVERMLEMGAIYETTDEEHAILNKADKS